MFNRICIICLTALAAATGGGAWAQAVARAPASAAVAARAEGAATLLRQAFEAAWAQQPEARSRDSYAEAARARRESADSWVAEPPAFEMSAKTDQLGDNEGNREYELGIAVPLWLPGERSAAGALAEAELRASESRTLAAQLRTAAAVRAAYWAWQRALVDTVLARDRVAGSRALAADVSRRVRAGDLARADGHQAEGALASAEVALAEAESAQVEAAQQLHALTGAQVELRGGEGIASEPDPGAGLDADTLAARHPALAELYDRGDVARRAMNLASTQGRANPELSLATTRERGASGDPWEQTVTVGLRIALGSDSRKRAKIASASAEAIEAEAQLGLERQRVQTGVEAARSRVRATRTQVAAAERRAQLARESRGFFDKAFRLGEADLPTRLRMEIEATDAERQLARTRIELATAVSALRQALGLLPE